MIDNMTIEGNISRINDNPDDNYIWFDICKNEKYKDANGNEQVQTSFFSGRIDRKKTINNELFKKGSWIIAKGIPKSYIKNNNKIVYMLVLDLLDPRNINKNKEGSPKFGYDTDGVMLWNGKRCESVEPTPEEQKEMDDLLSEFR